MPASNDSEYSRQLQEKFEFYVIALNFTLLALAIQTAAFGQSRAADALELTGWGCLLVSGLVGLSRIEWWHVIHHGFGEVDRWQRELEFMQREAAAGQREAYVRSEQRHADLSELIGDREVAIEEAQAFLDGLKDTHSRKYTAHKWFFVAGIIILVVARGIPAVETIFSGPYPEAVVAQE